MPILINLSAAYVPENISNYLILLTSLIFNHSHSIRRLVMLLPLKILM